MPKRPNDHILIDPDLVPLPVMAVNANVITGARGMELKAHQHRKSQLIYIWLAAC
jgi:hypothetical protein